MVRGRLALHGVRWLPFSEFLDVVWSCIYDDGPVMGDRQRYRDIVVKLYIEGKPAHEITWKDEKGKVHRLAPPPTVRAAKGGLKNVDDVKKLALALKQGQQAARAASERISVSAERPEVASPPDE